MKKHGKRGTGLVAGVSSTQLTAAAGSAEHAAARKSAHPSRLNTPSKTLEPSRPPAVVRKQARPLGSPGSKPVRMRATVMTQQPAAHPEASKSSQTGSKERQKQTEQLGQPLPWPWQGSEDVAPRQRGRPRKRQQGMPHAAEQAIPKQQQSASQPRPVPALNRLGLQQASLNVVSKQQQQSPSKPKSVPALSRVAQVLQQAQQQRQQRLHQKQKPKQKQKQQEQAPLNVTVQQAQFTDTDSDLDPLPAPKLVLQHFVLPQTKLQQPDSLTKPEPQPLQQAGPLGAPKASLGASPTVQPGSSSAVLGKPSNQPSSSQQVLQQPSFQKQQQPTARGVWKVSSERAHTAAQSLKKLEVTRAASRDTRYRGVTRHRRTQRWEAHIWASNRQIYLGSFGSQEEAAMAHDITSIRFCGGRQAVTNFYMENYEAELADLEAQAVQEPSVDSLPVTEQAAATDQATVNQQATVKHPEAAVVQQAAVPGATGTTGTTGATGSEQQQQQQQQEQQGLQPGPDWQLWRETLRGGKKSSSSSPSNSLSLLAAAAEEQDMSAGLYSMPQAPVVAPLWRPKVVPYHQNDKTKKKLADLEAKVESNLSKNRLTWSQRWSPAEPPVESKAPSQEQLPDSVQEEHQARPSRKRKRALPSKLKDAVLTGHLKQLAGTLATDQLMDPNDPDQPAQGPKADSVHDDNEYYYYGIPSKWGLRSERSSRVPWPPGCSRRLKASLAGQNGLAALRAAGLTDMYRQRLEASNEALAAAAAEGQGWGVECSESEGFIDLEEWEGEEEEPSCQEEEVVEEPSSSYGRMQHKRQRALRAAKRGSGEADTDVGEGADAATGVGQGNVELEARPGRRLRQQQQYMQQPLVVPKQEPKRRQQQKQLRLLLQQLKKQQDEIEHDTAEAAEAMQLDALEALADAAGQASPRAGPAAAAAAAGGAAGGAAGASAGASGSLSRQQSDSPMPGSEVVFQAMAAVLLQLETHSFGMGACITELMADWGDANTQNVLQSAAATAAQGAAGIAAVTAAAQAGNRVAAQQAAARTAIIQQHQHRSLVQRLLGHCLDLQGAGDQLLRRMRLLIAPHLPQNSTAKRGPHVPDNAGDVMVAVQQLQGLHRQHANILKSTAAALRQLRAALSAVLGPAQESSAAATLAALAGGFNHTVAAAASRSGRGGAPAASLDELAAHLARVLHRAESHAMGSMKLLGVSVSSS